MDAGPLRAATALPRTGARLHDRLLAYGRDDGATALARAVCNPGRASARGFARNGKRSVMDAGPLRAATALPRTGARLCRQHDRADARLGVAQRRSARADRR